MPRLWILSVLIVAVAPTLHAQTDIVFGNDFNGSGGFDRVCLNDGAGVYSCDFLPDNTDRRRTHGIAAADLDGDGDDDVIQAIIAGTGPGGVALSAANRVCRNTSAGAFACADLGVDLDDSEDVAVADLDGDGDVDAVFANRGSDDDGAVNRACVNDGTATFTCADVSSDAEESRAVTAVDLDGDGDADLAFANDGLGLTGARDRVCLNDGAGVFACIDVSDDARKSDDVTAADLDGDGDMDLVFAVFLGPDLVCLNDGVAGFACTDASATASDAFAVTAADLDGDGDADLAFANAILNARSTTNTVCLNDGAATFACRSVSTDTNNSRDVAAVDVDSDGDTDLLFANEDVFTGLGTSDRGQERLCLNDGTGAFTCADLSSPNDDSYALAVGNFQGRAVADEGGPAGMGQLELGLGPNPVRTEASVRVTLDGAEAVTVDVFDTLGRRVAVLHDGPLAAGTHRLTLHADALVPGVYVVRLGVGPEAVVRTLTVVR